MNIEALIAALKQAPVDFSQVMQVIDTHFEFQPTAFRNGEQHNEAGSNNGSCKVFAFASRYELDEAATLNAFGDFYTRDVLENPNGDDHANIRNFMRSGWAGIEFQGSALEPRTVSA